MAAPVPSDEAARLNALREYQILDTLPEAEYDDITFLATQICRTPIGIITLIDADRQWFKSRVGVPVRETPRDIAFCAHAILQPDLCVVADVLADERFATNPLVTSEPRIRFYAGAPLVTPRGVRLGTLCVLDHVPRELAPEQLEALRALSRQVMSLLELRRHAGALAAAVAERARAQAQLVELFNQVQKSHDDLLSILHQLHVGTAMTDPDGHITFLNEACRRFLGTAPTPWLGRHWEEVFGFEAEEKAQLKAMAARAPQWRRRVPARIEAPGGRHYWVDVDLQDDPRDAGRKVFFLYDMTEVRDLRRLLNERAQFHDMVGKSQLMQQVFQQIREVAAVDATVLIEGETGTGKELVARAIHCASHRKDRPFIAMNCAGLTDSLLASQLFGHKRGAFTGAIADHAGLFEAANGGTLFLDEIGDIPLNVQTSLLRVLQEREIVRLGESTPRKIDVRVLAATHHNLSDDVAKGTFRADLIYRIRVARILVPPLRARREDIPVLVAAFLAQSRATTEKPVQHVSDDAMQLLLTHPWPGNVRELKSAIEFAVIRCKGAVIGGTGLPPEIVGAMPLPTVGDDSGTDEKRRLFTALEIANGNRPATARLLGISKATLYRRLASHGVRSGK